MIYPYNEKKPEVKEAIFIAENSTITGEVILKKNVSIWFGAVLRADIAPITVGEGSNIQDNAVVHVDYGSPAVIGNYVTIGHSAVIHGCIIGDTCIVGMGAVVLSGAVIGANCIIGAGTLVTENKVFPDNSLIVGVPARAVRALKEDDISKIMQNALHYIEIAEESEKSYKY
ncbi:MAG: gamma carbonic anhydrase family protein [Spirochaetales bacterium]|nr:gamma carbonic anhydrase family protein [Spirochaetales bacterium]